MRHGGPRPRIFGINPSLQKIPLITYTGKEIFVHDNRHWNDFHEYKVYEDTLQNNKATFYDNISNLIENIDYKF